MAVPASGNSISLGGLAAEKDIDDYTDVDYDDVLSLKDITIGGNANGNSFVADATNGFSASKPDNAAPYKMSEFYSYDHDAASPACNLAYHDGGQGTFNYPINLGSATGTVTIEYQAYSIPDRFIFTWNGNTYKSGVESTGDFVGSQSHLSNLQATAGNSSATITTLTTSYGSGSGNAQNGGRGTITFNKNTSSSASNMQVSAPLGGTGWWFSVSCPGMQVIGGGSGVAPTVQTDNYSSLASTSFTMNGTTTNRGLLANLTSTGVISARGFVHMTGNQSANFIAGGSGVTTSQVDTTNTLSPFAKSLTGLTASTTYSYRAYASNGAGTTYGSIVKAETTSVSRTMYWTTDVAYPRANSTCNQSLGNIIERYYSTSPPAVGTTVYTSSTGTGTIGAGFWGYADGQLSTNRKITVNSSGVITAHSNC